MPATKKIPKILLTLALLVTAYLAGAYFFVDSYGRFCFDDLSKIPRNKVGLILGTSPELADGRRNLFFIYRINTATSLYENKKVDFLLISGDNSTMEYNEPQAMKEALVKKGIPEEKIFLDYAGFRTLDSVVRAKEIFGQTELTIISQKFHNERAIFIARTNGMQAVGANAKDVSLSASPRVRVREILARARVIVDVFVLKSQPKFLGEKILIE